MTLYQTPLQTMVPEDNAAAAVRLRAEGRETNSRDMVKAAAQAFLPVAALPVLT